MSNISRIAFEFWSGIGNVETLEKWAEAELKKENPHPDACDLFGLVEAEAERISLVLAEEIEGFTPVSEQGEIWAKEILANFCEMVLSEKISPNKFCHLVQGYDANFLGLRENAAGELEYPVWLGDLWNACDWCDESWSISNSPHLKQEIEKVLNAKT